MKSTDNVNFDIRVSSIEIYNEVLHDLLRGRSAAYATPHHTLTSAMHLTRCVAVVGSGEVEAAHL